MRIKVVECFAVGVALAEDGVPTESGLGAFEDEEFKKTLVVVERCAPFFIVILDGKFVARPCTTNNLFRSRCRNLTGTRSGT